MKRSRYSAELKESMLAKALAPNAPSAVSLAKEFNIPYATFYSWISMSKKQITPQTSNSVRPHDKSAESKLKAIFDTNDKTEAERGAYCREHGLYTVHLETWRQQILEALGAVTAKEKREYQQVKSEIKKLKNDLHRKDKALAEVSALLILKKKADLLWGENADD